MNRPRGPGRGNVAIIYTAPHRSVHRASRPDNASPIACGARIVAPLRWAGYADLETVGELKFCLACFPRHLLPRASDDSILKRTLVMLRPNGWTHDAHGPCAQQWAGPTVAVRPAQVLVYRLPLCLACLAAPPDNLHAVRVEPTPAPSHAV